MGVATGLAVIRVNKQTVKCRVTKSSAWGGISMNGYKFIIISGVFFGNVFCLAGQMIHRLTSMSWPVLYEPRDKLDTGCYARSRIPYRIRDGR